MAKRRTPTRHIEDVEHKHHPTAGDVLGPFYRRGAPFCTRVSPLLAPGDVLVVSGHVSSETGEPLRAALIEIWQASAAGHYDNDDPAHPPLPNKFTYRARFKTDRDGYYEFETVYPGPYKMDERTWRTPHIHYRVHARHHKLLTTQLFFDGAPYLDTDPFRKASLTIRLQATQAPAGAYWRGKFNIVLARQRRSAAPAKRRSRA